MRGLKFDGYTTQAYWEARVRRPETWKEFVELPLVKTLDEETQKQIWRLYAGINPKGEGRSPSEDAGRGEGEENNHEKGKGPGAAA